MNSYMYETSTTLSSMDVWSQSVPLRDQNVTYYINDTRVDELTFNDVKYAQDGDELCVVTEGGWFESSRTFRRIDNELWFMCEEAFTPWFDASYDVIRNYRYVEPKGSDYEPEAIGALAGYEAPMRQPIRKTTKLYMMGFQTHATKKRTPKGSVSIRQLSDIEGD